MQKNQGTPDPFSVDTSTAAADVAKDPNIGTKPVAGGRPFMPRTVTKGVRGPPNVRKKYCRTYWPRRINYSNTEKKRTNT